MKKMVIRLTESDLNNIIKSTVNKILTEDMGFVGGNANDGVSDVNMQQDRDMVSIAKSFREALIQSRPKVHEGDDFTEAVDKTNGEIFTIEYSVESDQYSSYYPSSDYDVPGSYDTEGGWEFTYMKVMFGDEEVLFELHQGDERLKKMEQFFIYDEEYIPTEEDYFSGKGW